MGEARVGKISFRECIPPWKGVFRRAQLVFEFPMRPETNYRDTLRAWVVAASRMNATISQLCTLGEQL